ncbi:hypothetical protein BC835DRAFT_1343276 [Cytidiella melzeri]|nr:hypothetical protein BC835DRAFT_1343276 [Cytidiella melzeri]
MAFFSRPSSSAVKIVAPSLSHSEPSSPKAQKKDSTQRQCRNILIYGSCKFQDKGCIYYHPPRDPSPPAPESPTPSAALPAQAVNAPVFVPKNSGSPVPAAAQPAALATTSSNDTEYPYDDGYDSHGYAESDAPMSMSYLAEQLQSLNSFDHPVDGQQQLDYDPAHPMDVFYAPQHAFTRQPLNYHLYTHPRPDSMQSRYFISDTFREDLQRRSEAVHATPPPHLSLPDETQGYHSLVPLEPIIGDRRKFGNWYSTVYKAINSADGIPYALRRVENYRLNSQTAFSSVEAWSHVKHPSLVAVKEAFTTRAFNDNSLVVVYDYFPNSQTLFEAHLRPKAPQFQNGRLQSQNTRVPERTLWSYIVQIAAAMKAVHDVGLAMRIVDATKILLTGQNRVRVSSCGIVDILTHEARQDMGMLQQEDMTMFGRLIFMLCCNSPSATSNMAKAMESLNRHYSQELKNVVLYLVAKPNHMKSVRHLCEMIAPQTLVEFDEAQAANDRLEGELMSELENGRLVRLLCKFGFINERPEFARDPRWSETGDRYIIKLFRDFVFHQVDEHGNPVVNLGHVLTCLNKLDAGVDERIMLVSRDEQSCLVVSYREIKSCIETAFGYVNKYFD